MLGLPLQLVGLYLACAVAIVLVSACGPRSQPTALPVQSPAPLVTIAAESPLAMSSATPSLTAIAAPTPLAVATASPSPTSAAAASPTVGRVQASIPPATVPPKPHVEQGKATNTRLWRARGAELAAGDMGGLVVGEGALRLPDRPDGYAPAATLTSEVHEAAFPFDNAVLSWNAISPAGTSLRFELRVRVDAGPNEQWTQWYAMGTWGPGGGSSVRGQSDAWADVVVDTLELRRLATAWQYRVAFTSNGQATPSLRALGVVYADLRQPLSGPPVALPGGWIRELAVPAYSQLEEDEGIARVICSPTSLAMVLNYYGKAKSVAEVVQGVRDSGAGIFGNWPLNTAYAATLGLDSYVDRFYSMDQVAGLIAQGRPVIASIRFGPGELPGGPLNQTGGHLIVIRGFTADGNVIANDPFGATASQVRSVYRRADLEKVWLRSGGVVYALDPLPS